jgi:hypothetical protein
MASKFLYTLLLLTPYIGLSGQARGQEPISTTVIPEQRIEFPMQRNEAKHALWLNGQEGAIHTFILQEEQKQTARHFVKVDTNLKMTDIRQVIYYPKNLKENLVSESDLYFYTIQYSKYRKEFVAHRIDKRSLKVDVFKGTFAKKNDHHYINSSAEQVSGISSNRVFMGSRLNLWTPALFDEQMNASKYSYYFRATDRGLIQIQDDKTIQTVSFLDFDKNETVSFNLELQGHKKSELVACELVPKLDEQELHLHYKTQDSAGKHAYLIYAYDEGRRPLDQMPFEIALDSDKKRLNYLTLSYNERDENYLVSGAYIIKRGFFERLDRQGMGMKADGFVTTQIDKKGKVGPIQLQNFYDMDNFTSYLSARKEKRVLQKSARKKAKGEEKRTDLLAGVHGIYTQGKEQYIITEFFYPTYRSYIEETKPNTPQLTFDGFQYTHALVAKVGAEGTLLWTNIITLELRDRPGHYAEQVRVNLNDAQVLTLSYTDRNSIQTARYDKVTGEIIKAEEVAVAAGKNEQVKRTYNSNLMHWYGNNYLMQARQKVANKEAERGARRRKIVCFSKLTY